MLSNSTRQPSNTVKAIQVGWLILASISGLFAVYLVGGAQYAQDHDAGALGLVLLIFLPFFWTLPLILITGALTGWRIIHWATPPIMRWITGVVTFLLLIAGIYDLILMAADQG
jgi:hypothetical protein